MFHNSNESILFYFLIIFLWKFYQNLFLNYLVDTDLYTMICEFLHKNGNNYYIIVRLHKNWLTNI